MAESDDEKLRRILKKEAEKIKVSQESWRTLWTKIRKGRKDPGKRRK
jgi:hypothetical protein